MSTRAQVGFYQNNCKDLNDFESLLYHHSDGYPSYLFPNIATFLIDFYKNRGISDLEYAAANLIAYWRLGYIWSEHDYCEQNNNSLKKLKKLQSYAGLGICKDFHADIAYFYAIYEDGKIEIYKVSRWDNQGFTLIGKTDIKTLSESSEDTIERFAEEVEAINSEIGSITL